MGYLGQILKLIPHNRSIKYTYNTRNYQKEKKKEIFLIAQFLFSALYFQQDTDRLKFLGTFLLFSVIFRGEMLHDFDSMLVLIDDW